MVEKPLMSQFSAPIFPDVPFNFQPRPCSGKREDYIPVIREFYDKLTFKCTISRSEHGDSYEGVEELAVEG